ncbi:MAG: hypothetical protein AAF591_02385, partial [Verrucomicrobiota bacterium]
ATFSVPFDRGGSWLHSAEATLLSEAGDYEGALEVYEEIDDGFHKSIAVLQRHALVLKELGRGEEAVELLERVNLNGNVPSAERVAMRELAVLYADLGREEDLVELAGRAIDSGNEAVIIAVSDAMVEGGMGGEALDLLLLGSRRLKSDEERARLLLRLMERVLEPAGDGGAEGEVAGAAGATKWGSLLETVFACGLEGVEEEQRRLLEILRSAEGMIPGEWGQFLDRAEWEGGMGLFAAACRLEMALAEDEKAGLGRMLREFRGARSADEVVYLRMAIETCLAHGRAGPARQLLEILRGLQPSVFSHAKEAIAVYAAQGDEAALALVYQELLRDRVEDGYRERAVILVERGALAEAFVSAGQVERALRVYEHYYSQPLTMRRDDRLFYEGYARLLIGEGRYFDAERVLRRVLRKNIEFDLGVVIDLYDAWGRLGEIAGAMRKFELSSGLRKEVEVLAMAREREREKG